jgi:hypothetical protein
MRARGKAGGHRGADANVCRHHKENEGRRGPPLALIVVAYLLAKARRRSVLHAPRTPTHTQRPNAHDAPSIDSHNHTSLAAFTYTDRPTPWRCVDKFSGSGRTHRSIVVSIGISRWAILLLLARPARPCRNRPLSN